MRRTNDQLKELESTAIKAEDAIGQANASEDANSNSASKVGFKLKPVDVAGDGNSNANEENEDDSVEEDEEPKVYRSFQYNSTNTQSASNRVDETIGNMMSKLMFMSNRFDHQMFLGFNDGKFKRAYKYLSVEDMNKIVECS